jgi:hypothetical protein
MFGTREHRTGRDHGFQRKNCLQPWHWRTTAHIVSTRTVDLYCMYIIDVALIPSTINRHRRRNNVDRNHSTHGKPCMAMAPRKLMVAYDQRRGSREASASPPATRFPGTSWRRGAPLPLLRAASAGRGPCRHPGCRGTGPSCSNVA